MILLFDVGNTHTHLGLADAQRVRTRANVPTLRWAEGAAEPVVRKFAGLRPDGRGERRRSRPQQAIQGAVICSVVPSATPLIKALLRSWNIQAIELTSRTVCGIGIDYPKPESIGPDRLANAV